MHTLKPKYHTSINIAPSYVTIDNAAQAWANIASRLKSRLQEADYRVEYIGNIRRAKGAFKKDYESTWSKELFKIVPIDSKRQLPVYVLYFLKTRRNRWIFLSKRIDNECENTHLQNFFRLMKL